jgi:hypothetical protein
VVRRARADMFKMRLSLARRHLFSLQHGNTAAHSTLLRGGPKAFQKKKKKERKLTSPRWPLDLTMIQIRYTAACPYVQVESGDGE